MPKNNLKVFFREVIISNKPMRATTALKDSDNNNQEPEREMEEEELDLDLHAITGKHLSSNKQLTIEKTFVRLPSEYSQSTLNK